MIQLAWGHLLHQKDSALSEWYRQRTSDARGGARKTMIVALARKLLIALWRLVTTGDWWQPDVGLWPSSRGLDWTRRLGALPAKRMSASWSRPYVGSTEYKRGSRDCSRPMQAPLGSLRGRPSDRG